MADILEKEPRELSWEESVRILDCLPQIPLCDRAREVYKLLRNPSPGIRQRALSIGAAVLSEEQLINFLRNDADDVIRNSGLEILKLRGSRSFTIALNLLYDADSDIVLQAILILDHLRDPRAFNSLRKLLTHKNTNIVQAAITAIGHLGDARAIPDLLPFLKSDSWLQIAAVQALGDIRSPLAVKPLKELLVDLFLGSLSAEALARIGGLQAFQAISEHWVRFRSELEAENMIGLIAHVLEGLTKKPKVSPEFLITISPYLIDNTETACAAARCILVLGPNERDKDALYLLSESHSNSSELPACFLRRKDLIPKLLKIKGLPCIWGIQLAARFPRDTPISDIASALSREEILAHIDTVVKCLQKIRDPLLVKHILKLYIRLPIETRHLIIPVLKFYKTHLQAILKHRVGLDKETRLILHSFLGGNHDKIALEIKELPDEDKISVLSQISSQKSNCKHLPWREWLEEAPEKYGPVAAQVAVNAKMQELIPLLRNVLKRTPLHEVIRALGEMKDRESVPILTSYLIDANSMLKAVIIENLGFIGGPEVRRVLRETIEGFEGKTASLAYRALSQCAVEEDISIFQKAITHPDWVVRLACVDVFGRFPNSENIEGLTRLAADPIPVVAQRATEFLGV